MSLTEDARHKDGLSIGIITAPIYEAGNVPLTNLISVLRESNGITLVTGNEGYDLFRKDPSISVFGLRFREGKNVLSRLARHVILELRVLRLFAKASANVDLWVFFIGGDSMLVPLLYSRIRGLPVVMAFAGSATLVRRSKNDMLVGLSRLVSSVACYLSDRLVVYSPSLIKEWQLEGFASKISIAREHFLDLEKFRPTSSLAARRKLVGYVGRLSREKGAQDFVDAVHYVLSLDSDAEFVVVGSGELKEMVREKVRKAGARDKVSIDDWIPHDQLPELLNRMQLLVIPSYTEGLPNIMIEAMACGTPVLAYPTGAIPDFVKDGVTGYLMREHDPRSMSEEIVRALHSPNLSDVARTSRELVEREFSFAKAAESWKRVLDSI